MIRVRICILGALVSGCSVEPEDRRAAERAARDALDRAERGLDHGAERARTEWEKAREGYGPRAKQDWERLKEAAGKVWAERDRRGIDPEPLPPLPDRWWTRGPDVTRCSGPDGGCQVEAWFVRAGQRHPFRVRGEIRLTPVYDPTHPERGNTGVELHGIPSDSVLRALGFEDGDELQSINGLAVADPMAQLELYSQLGDRRGFEVVYVRRGETKRRVIEVVDALD